MTLLELVHALVHAAADDGANGAEDFSPTTQRHLDEVKRRYEAAFTATDDTVPAFIVRQILDGES